MDKRFKNRFLNSCIILITFFIISCAGQDHEENIETLLRWWKNSRGVNYPVAWELYIKPQQRKIIIEPVLDNQEMNLSVNYWEGMVTVTENNKRIGKGYLELTGY